jgi:transposase-like protein
MREKHTLGRVQQRRSRAEVEQLVDAFERSGLRRREFCLKHGVVLGTLDFWRKRRLQERGAIAGHRLGTQNADARAKAASGDRLVAVELAGLPVGAVGGGLAVVVSRGRRIEVSRGFDAATLERLLAVLEQA